MAMDHPLVLYDGSCNFCDSTVNFIISRDPEGRFHFAPLQGQIARGILRRNHLPEEQLDTIILVEGGQLYARSTAVLRTMRQLRGLWPLLSIFLLVPAFIRDLVYGIIARNRYRWFGRQDVCRIPDAQVRARFLD
jgi:predicted DCC family thiol-disulfide oxidoreductase YuxK